MYKCYISHTFLMFKEIEMVITLALSLHSIHVSNYHIVLHKYIQLINFFKERLQAQPLKQVTVFLLLDSCQHQDQETHHCHSLRSLQSNHLMLEDIRRTWFCLFRSPKWFFCQLTIALDLSYWSGQIRRLFMPKPVSPSFHLSWHMSTIHLLHS